MTLIMVLSKSDSSAPYNTLIFIDISLNLRWSSTKEGNDVFTKRNGILHKSGWQYLSDILSAGSRDQRTSSNQIVWLAASKSQQRRTGRRWRLCQTVSSACRQSPAGWGKAVLGMWWRSPGWRWYQPVPCIVPWSLQQNMRISAYCFWIWKFITLALWVIQLKHMVLHYPFICRGHIHKWTLLHLSRQARKGTLLHGTLRWWGWCEFPVKMNMSIRKATRVRES